MKNLEELKIISNHAILIAEDLWPLFELQKTGTSKEYDISKFNLSYVDKAIDNIVLESSSTKPSCFYQELFPEETKITCDGKGGLAHELCHFLFRIYTQKKDTNSGHLTSYIRKKPDFNLGDYFDLNLSDTEKAIGYLYLADNEEITSKITGYRIDEFESYFAKRDSGYYEEMKSFVFNDNSLQRNTDAVNKLKQYLAAKGNFDFNKQKIENYIQEQGNLFFEFKRMVLQMNNLNNIIQQAAEKSTQSVEQIEQELTKYLENKYFGDSGKIEREKIDKIVEQGKLIILATLYNCTECKVSEGWNNYIRINSYKDLLWIMLSPAHRLYFDQIVNELLADGLIYTGTFGGDKDPKVVGLTEKGKLFYATKDLQQEI